MGCKLQANITKENCQYSVAGVKALYLFNYNSANAYQFEDGAIETITLANEDEAYKIDFVEGSASWSDELAVNGNGGKYRTHTVNFTLSEYNYQLLNQGDALSLGKFTAVVVDKSGRVVVLGRNNGLSATSFNYASGAADADANGWTTVLAGTETEIGKLLKDESVIASIAAEEVTVED
ncbi:hypothetical protein [Viscerimonas tarda]